MAIHGVLRDYQASEIHGILPHEHLICDFNRVSNNPDQILNDAELAISELRLLDTRLVNCVVDATPIDLGRSPELLRRIARAWGHCIVMGTGWYHERFYPQMIDESPTDQLAAVMIRELSTGFSTNSGELARAGVIGELGTNGPYMSAKEERVFRAAAFASIETGAPIITHTGVYPSGIQQVELLLGIGVDPARICVGHVDMYLDDEYHDALLDMGVSIAFDTAGRQHLNPDVRRASSIRRLIEGGWLSRILISSDRCFRSDLRAFGGAGYAHTLTEFARLLVREGLSEKDIDTMRRVNSTRLLSW